MTKRESDIVAFKVHQAVGSMAIEGVRISASSQAKMFSVAMGQQSFTAVRQTLLAKYKQS